MKTYFMAWESENKRGHSIWEFDLNDDGSEITPRQALREMIGIVTKQQSESDAALRGVVSAIQFNQVT